MARPVRASLAPALEGGSEKSPSAAPGGGVASFAVDVSSTMRAAARRSLALPDDDLAAACDESFFVGGGPGGQHRNKTATGVRLAHRPTGVVVTATERRSQAQNRAAALARLRVRLATLAHEPKPRRATEPTRASRQRRLAAKKHVARRKAERRGGFD